MISGMWWVMVRGGHLGALLGTSSMIYACHKAPDLLGEGSFFGWGLLSSCTSRCLIPPNLLRCLVRVENSLVVETLVCCRSSRRPPVLSFLFRRVGVLAKVAVFLKKHLGVFWKKRPLPRCGPRANMLIFLWFFNDLINISASWSTCQSGRFFKKHQDVFWEKRPLPRCGPRAKMLIFLMCFNDFFKNH